MKDPFVMGPFVMGPLVMGPYVGISWMMILPTKKIVVCGLVSISKWLDKYVKTKAGIYLFFINNYLHAEKLQNKRLQNEEALR